MLYSWYSKCPPYLLTKNVCRAASWLEPVFKLRYIFAWADFKHMEQLKLYDVGIGQAVAARIVDTAGSGRGAFSTG